MTERIVGGIDVTEESKDMICRNCEHCYVVIREDGSKFYNCSQTWSKPFNKIIGEIEDIDVDVCSGKRFEERKKPPLPELPKVMFPMLHQKLDLYKQVKDYIKKHPVYYDSSKVWWLWNKNKQCWERVDETDILIAINNVTHAPNVHSTIKNELLEAFKQLGRKHRPKKAKKTWIQFRNTIYDIKSDEKVEISPKYFITNPIPWDLGKKSKTPTMDKIFEQWVGKEHVKTLYEILSYCLLPDYPLHRIFCLLGSGMNGKSCFLRILKKLVGLSNTTSANLDKLVISSFEKTRLHKKLVCLMSETNFNEIAQTSTLKELTGGDLTGFEYKNKDPFEDVNYAKIIIATNNLPTTTDKTLGYYRRWVIIDFPNLFSEKIDILETIPREEYKNLTLKCINILKNLLNKREFYNEGTVEDRQKRYEDRSNPFDKFWDEFVDDNNPDEFIFSYEFKKKFDDWCKDNRFRTISDRIISQKMKEKDIKGGRADAGMAEGKRKQYRCWYGVKWKK